MADEERAVVNLTRIYTRGGDGGQTSLGDGRRVPKDAPRIVACGDVDELNAAVGMVMVEPLPGEWSAWLARVQNDLFDLGADLAVPEQEGPDTAARTTRTRLRMEAGQATWLEGRCDEVNADLPPLTSFVLPGGTRLAAQLHVARTVCRRAERSVVGLARDEAVNPHAVAYLNRLSDLLFILARAANPPGQEPLWVPGAGR